jgi:xanthine dehydrogenase accessory factor
MSHCWSALGPIRPTGAPDRLASCAFSLLSMSIFRDIAQARVALDRSERVCLVQVGATHGSVPRSAGAWMALWNAGVAGTIGGGQLEYQAMAEARAWLAQPDGQRQPLCCDYPLGPALGQCCGGRVSLHFQALSHEGLDRLCERACLGVSPVALFGGGHIGHALVRVLLDLPFHVHWVDSREQPFQTLWPQDHGVPANLKLEHSDPVQAAVAGLAPGARVIIMSYSHAEDFEIVRACLERRRSQQDLPFIGLIGSKSKWATFSNRLRQRGYSDAEIERVTCPIGIAGIRGKEPEVIAVAVAAQLLQQV